MCNSIFLGKKTLADAEDGKKIKVMIEGTYYTDEDGTRKIEVSKVDGDAVEDMEDDGYSHEDLMNQDSEDALRLFIIKKGK